MKFIINTSVVVAIVVYLIYETALFVRELWIDRQSRL